MRGEDARQLRSAALSALDSEDTRMAETSLPTLKDFTDALGVTWPIAAAAAIGSTLILVAARYGLAEAAIPSWMLIILFVIDCFAIGVIIANLLKALRTVYSKWNLWRQERQQRRRHLRFLSSLPVHEQELLGYLARTNQQAFSCPANHERIVSLMTKGLIEMQGGTHELSNWPHFVPDHVWSEVMKDQRRFTYDLRRGDVFDD